MLITVFVIAVMPYAVAEESSEGATALARYETARSKQQTALAQGDSEAFAALDTEAANALSAAGAAFKRDYEASNDLQAALGYVKVLRIKGDHDLAAEFAGKVISRGLENAVLWREYGSCLLTMGKKHAQDAIDALYTSLEMDRTSPEAVVTFNELADYYIEMGMPEAASTVVAEALAIEPTDVRARLAKVVVDVYNGNIGEAGSLLTAVGKGAQPYDTVLRAHLRLALADFDTQRRSFPDTAENHYAYARLLYFAARLPQAIMACQRAARLAKTDTGIWNFLGAIQGQLGDYAGAQRSYEASLKANPEQPDVRQTIEKLKEAQQPAAQQAVPGAGKGPLR